MKKLISLVLALVMLAGVAAVGEGFADSYDITVWVAEEIKELTAQQIDAFNSNNQYGIKFNATIEAVSEAVAADNMVNDVEAGGDIFCFPQDQFARLVKAGALSKLGVAATEKVTAENAAGVVAAAKSGDALYAYPLTADNGYFMFYDKSIIPEEDIDSLEALIADCEAAQKYFAFELQTSSWYLASFFFGTGCVSEWTTDDAGTFISVRDTFNSPEGLIAVKGMEKLVKSPFHLSSSKADSFESNAAIVVTGIWDYELAKQILGDNLGAAPLPAFTVDGTDYTLKPFMGYKFIGVKTQTDAVKAAALHKLAQYLTSEEAQLQRFEAVTWAPVNTNAAASDAVKANPVIAADMLQQQCCTAQGQVNDGWWNLAAALSATAKETDDEETLKGALQTYADGLEKLKNLREGLLFVGQWNGWNNADEADTYILTGEGDVKSVTLEVAADLPYFGGRIVNIGSWETGMGAAQVKTGADLIDVAGAGDDNNIVFLAPGTYTVSIDTASGEISIVAG